MKYVVHGRVLLIVALLAAVGFWYAGNFSTLQDATALSISRECPGVGNVRVECLSDKILSYVKHNSAKTGDIFDSFWRLAKSGSLSDDARIFSDMAHDAGMALIDEVSIEDAVKFCGASFKQGCIHGAVMEYVEEQYKGPADTDSLLSWCDTISGESDMVRANCVHAIGHELTAKLKKPLSEVMNECVSLHGMMRDACASGVLMEYSRGTAGLGRHTHEMVGSVELPCIEVGDEYKTVCYASAGSYRQYVPGQEDFKSSYEFCSRAPREEYIDACMAGVTERAAIAMSNDQDKLDMLCQGVVNGEARTRCQRSMWVAQ